MLLKQLACNSEVVAGSDLGRVILCFCCGLPRVILNFQSIVVIEASCAELFFKEIANATGDRQRLRHSCGNQRVDVDSVGTSIAIFNEPLKGHSTTLAEVVGLKILWRMTVTCWRCFLMNFELVTADTASLR